MLALSRQSIGAASKHPRKHTHEHTYVRTHTNLASLCFIDHVAAADAAADGGVKFLKSLRRGGDKRLETKKHR